MFLPICGKSYNMLRAATHYKMFRSAERIMRRQRNLNTLQLFSLSNSLRIISSNISFHVSTGPGMHQCRQS
uniref:Uncharacterized protein n=1 Tax=Arundo donax TaxID=35708 RepID=A0A0A9EZC7_ARUDO